MRERSRSARQANQRVDHPKPKVTRGEKLTKYDFRDCGWYSIREVSFGVYRLKDEQESFSDPHKAVGGYSRCFKKMMELVERRAVEVKSRKENAVSRVQMPNNNGVMAEQLAVAMGEKKE